MKMHLRLFLIFCFLFVSNATFPSQKKEQSFIDYISKYSSIAVKHRDKYKIPASITLAQGLLESGAGLSDLAKVANNHFGIKCHSDWTGETIFRNDDKPNECFRKYKVADESFEDHAKFLQKPRYAVLFTYSIKDYESWAKGLQTCGYATDKGYANRLIQIIEDYELYKYDIQKSEKEEKGKKGKKGKKEKKNFVPLRDVYRASDLIYVIAKADDSFDQISEDTGIKIKKLIKYNEVPEDFPLKQGDIIYLEKKKKVADKPHTEYTVKIGDSMHDISQKYGILMKNLYKLNKKKSDYIPAEGDVLKLR